MMRTTAIVLAALTLAAPLAHAQRISRLTGEKLLEACSSPKGKLICEAYISGVGDGIAGSEKNMTRAQGQDFAGATCIPNDTTANQLHQTVVSYLRAHPEAGAKPAAISTFAALHDAYPCQKQ